MPEKARVPLTLKDLVGRFVLLLKATEVLDGTFTDPIPMKVIGVRQGRLRLQGEAGDTVAALPYDISIEGVCRVCGCTDEFGCDVGCEWVEAGLCSACVRE